MMRIPIAAAVMTTLAVACSAALGARARGIDVSSFQGTINWSQVAAGGVQFAWIRSSTGNPTVDSRYAANIAQSRASGVLAGAYHYVYPADNTATVEANLFLATARNAMTAGYLRPVLDLESGDNLSAAALTDFAIAFNTQIFNATGTTPIVYANTNYATNEVDARIAAYDFWLARYSLSSTAATAYTQALTASPPSNSYGKFATAANPAPWDFWQYSSSGSNAQVPGIPAGNGVDLDVANGDVEFVKDFLIPAVYSVNADGTYGDPANWNGAANSNYVPTSNERVILNRPAGDYTVTVPSGARFGRSLDSSERLVISGGSLAIAQYATLNNATVVSGGAFSAASVEINSTLLVSAGSLTTGAITGTGTLSVTGGTVAASSLVNAATLTIGGGTTTIANAITGAGSTTVSDGTLSAASVSQNPLALVGTGRLALTSTTASVVKSLRVDPAATLDVRLAKLVVDYGGPSPADAFRRSVLEGSITSSNAQAGLGIGYVEATRKFAVFPGIFGGAIVDATSILASLALLGDTNLDDTVNLVDLATLAASFGNAGLWQDGDATYDGLVDQFDLAALALNFGKTLAGDGTVSGGGDPNAFADALAGFPSLVPEPTTLVALAMLGATLRRRRHA